MQVEAMAGTPNWLAARRGMLTASKIADALAVRKDGKLSEARRKLMFDLLAERMTGIAVERFVTPAMQWGIEQQVNAAAAYQAETGVILGPEVFVLHPEIDWLGATPDALLGNDGLVEFKCPTTPTHLRWVMEGSVPPEYQPQMLCQLACTRRRFVDFVSFDPRVKHPQLFIRRFEPESGEIERIEEGARAFLAELQAMAEQLEAA